MPIRYEHLHEALKRNGLSLTPNRRYIVNNMGQNVSMLREVRRALGKEPKPSVAKKSRPLRNK